MTKREWVTFIEDVKDEKAKARTEDEGLLHAAALLHTRRERQGTRWRALLTREGGKARRAVFKGWRSL